MAGGLLIRDIDPLNLIRIGVATAYGRPYYRFSRALRMLGLRFDSILPGDIPRYTGSVVLTTADERPSRGCGAHVICEDVLERHPTVLRGMLVGTLDNRFEEPDLVLGVDPGKRTGLSVSYYGREIERSIHSSVEGLVAHMIEVMGALRAARKVVKIGDGKMRMAREIGDVLNLRYCSDFELHFVDERGTSLKIKNCNQGGRRDMLSARVISRRDGRARHVLPLSMTG